MRRGSGSEDEGVQGNPQVVVAPESQGNERFGELTPERRLEELRAEMEKLSQVISGSARDSELASGRQDRCVELLVADQLKKNLSEEALRYVTLQEGRQWVNAPELAASLRTFEEAQGMNSAARQKVSESQDASVYKLDTQRSSRGGKVQKLEIESPVLEAQGEIATMEGVITQAVAKNGDDEVPQGSRASPGETQAAGKKETSASEEVREKEQAGSTQQITGAGQDGIVERHRERSCFVRVPTGPRNLVQVGKRKRSRASEVFGRNGGPLGDDRGLWPPPTIIPDVNTLSRAPKGRWGYGSGASGVDKTRED
ncbi:hypothetical protein HPB52_011756 [Rhipicephalus sanguineus]|uniref:Uncharacterized protein n=1 Tax=Rhipicephalus sanguineus TaxID=34632 RepID=A0A9D4PRJ9_RHISA|nr:hypothetical protein HPB52_011756 [Rhipicephalus sanguineus]